MSCWAAEAPLHLSIVWIPVWARDPRTTGSLGAGLVLEPPVRVVACSGSGVEGPLPGPARRCLEALGWRGDAALRVEAPYPLGYGLGLSGAVALAACAAYAAHRGLSVLRAADEAHVAEVLESTGLGDVTAVYTAWGLEVRIRPGAPGAGGLAEPIPLEPRVVYAVPVAAGDTRTEITRAEELGDAARHAYEAIRREPSLEALAEAAEVFTMRATPPPPRVARLIAELRRVSDLVVYKKGTLAVVPSEGLEEEARALLSTLGEVYTLRIATRRFTLEYLAEPRG